MQVRSTHCIRKELLNFWVGCQHVKIWISHKHQISKFSWKKKEIFATWQPHPHGDSSTEQAAHARIEDLRFPEMAPTAPHVDSPAARSPQALEFVVPALNSLISLPPRTGSHPSSFLAHLSLPSSSKTVSLSIFN